MELELEPITLPGVEDKRPMVIAGPCSAETEEQVMSTAKQLADKGLKLFRAGIWKPRTKPGGFEGVGVDGLAWLKEVKKETGMYVSTEVATAKHVYECLKAGIDLFWVGARTTANPFAVQEIADALKGVDIPVLVKNPVNPDLELWIGALERIHNAGLKRLGAIHRGFSSYDILNSFTQYIRILFNLLYGSIAQAIVHLHSKVWRDVILLQKHDKLFLIIDREIRLLHFMCLFQADAFDFRQPFWHVDNHAQAVGTEAVYNFFRGRFSNAPHHTGGKIGQNCVLCCWLHAFKIFHLQLFAVALMRNPTAADHQQFAWLDVWDVADTGNQPDFIRVEVEYCIPVFFI